MKILKLPLIVAVGLISLSAAAQKKPINTVKASFPTSVNRPKLVVGLVIDQMRWDYLYRYYSRYGSGGFKRLINEGFSVENTFIPYTPTYTACGHSSIYTGSVPAINGIIANSWYDPEYGRVINCVEDTDVKTVGSTSRAGEVSPKNLLSTTITDELRLATNFRGKTISMSLKDRGAILPGGHTSNGSYWYDENGSFITSTFYMQQLPDWVADFNKVKLADKFYKKNWVPLYPISTYTQSTTDDKPYEGLFKGEKSATFPHSFTEYIGKDYGKIRSSPYGNTLLLDFAKTAIIAENLGSDNFTDFLAVSCSATDYVGHQYGPNSIEAEDTYLRLDKDLEEFFNYLDKQVGKGNYLFFLTADHGAAHVPGFMEENKLPGGTISNRDFAKNLNTLLEAKFKIKNTVIAVMNNQVIFNKPLIDSVKADFEAMKLTCISWLKLQKGVADAVDNTRIAASTLPQIIKERVTNGYNARRSGDIYFILQPNWMDAGKTGTTHGSWNPADSHIPLVFMGWNVKAGKTNNTYYMTDIAATLAAMLHIQMPNGSIGSPIPELFGK